MEEERQKEKNENYGDVYVQRGRKVRKKIRNQETQKGRKKTIREVKKSTRKKKPDNNKRDIERQGKKKQ